MTRYGMAIDMTRCYGCQTCAAACKVANNLPKDLVYNRVLTIGGTSNDCAAGSYPDCTLDFLPMQCQHCDNPSCLNVCPTGATQKREDGIVWVDNELCIGCESCIKACPYEGVRTLIANEPEYYLDVVVGEFDAPTHKAGTVEKCTFCNNLIDRGEVPACIYVPPARGTGATLTIPSPTCRSTWPPGRPSFCRKRTARDRRSATSASRSCGALS